MTCRLLLVDDHSLIRAGVHSLAPILRWAVRNGSVQRARRRMGLLK